MPAPLTLSASEARPSASPSAKDAANRRNAKSIVRAQRHFIGCAQEERSKALFPHVTAQPTCWVPWITSSRRYPGSARTECEFLRLFDHRFLLRCRDNGDAVAAR